MPSGLMAIPLTVGVDGRTLIITIEHHGEAKEEEWTMHIAGIRYIYLSHDLFSAYLVGIPSERVCL